MSVSLRLTRAQIEALYLNMQHVDGDVTSADVYLVDDDALVVEYFTDGRGLTILDSVDE